MKSLFFPPHHLVHHPDIALYDLHDLAGHVVGVVWDGNAVVAVGGHPDGKLY